MTKTKFEQLRELFAAQPHTRNLAAMPSTFNAEKRTVDVIIASESPAKVVDYDRWAIVDEVLLMDGMQLPEGRTQVPLLNSHDRTEVGSVLGSLTNFRAEGDRMVATLSFASTEDAVEAETLVREGHLTDLSVGYVVLASTWIEDKAEVVVNGKSYKGPLKVSTAWKLKEVSLTPIGADELSIVRSSNADKLRALMDELGLPANASNETLLEFVRNEIAKQAAKDETGLGASAPSRSEQITIKGITAMTEEQKAALRAENKRELEALANKFGSRIQGGTEAMGRMLKDAVDLDIEPAQFRGMIFSKVTDGEPLEEPASAIGMNAKEAKLFSISRALIAAGAQDWRNAPFEREVLEATGKRIAERIPGRSANEANRISLPYEVQRSAMELTPAVIRALESMGVNTRDLLVGTASAGGYTVQTNVFSLIDVLRNRLVLSSLGVTMWEGLTGQVDVPRHATASSGSYVAENGSVSESNQVFEAIQLRPKTLGAFTDISRRLLMQSNVGIDAWVTLELAKALQVAVEAGAIAGTGTGNAPTGILSTSGIGSVAGGTNGLAPAWSHIVDLESEVAIDNADFGSLAYLTNAKARGKLKKVFVDATSNAERVWDTRAGNTPLNGYPGLVSNAVPSNLTKGTSNGVCSAIIFGNWSDLILAFWGVLDILVDPYTGGAAGTLRIREMMDYDVALRHPESFSAMQDALTT
jgi:HK97 family phage major capsid protein